MPELASYQETLDEIYRTFMAVKDRVKGRRDRETRRPERLVGLAARLRLLPEPARVLRVTGSKGKGTTARAAAAMLQVCGEGPVGLLISPEEIEHTDRMRVDGLPIPQTDLVRLRNGFAAELDRLEAELPEDGYLSPSGTFLLIALAWFRERGVAAMVLETGRGAASDEVGIIPSRASVVTSILPEHLDKLGPAIGDVAREKLAIGRTSERTILSADAFAWNERLGVLPRDRVEQVARPCPGRGCGSAVGGEVGDGQYLPEWLEQDLALARSGVALLLGRSVAEIELPDTARVSASYFIGRFRGVAFAAEAVIHTASLDYRLLARWQRSHARPLAVCSLPDDKDRDGIRAALRTHGFTVMDVVLEGTRGYLDYTRARTEGSIVCRYDDVERLRAHVGDVIRSSQADFLYFAGTQTFIRLVRRAVA